MNGSKITKLNSIWQLVSSKGNWKPYMPKSHLFIKFKVEFRVKYAAIVPPRLNTLIGFTSSCAISNSV